MEEQLITFETAKLAKEKGFELNSCSYYQLHKEGQFRYTTHIEGEDSDQGSWVNKDIENRIPIATQSLLQKWLREEHNLILVVNNWYNQPVNGEIYQDCFQPIINCEPQVNILCKTYEEALEKGLQEALKLIEL